MLALEHKTRPLQVGRAEADQDPWLHLLGKEWGSQVMDSLPKNCSGRRHDVFFLEIRGDRGSFTLPVVREIV